MKQLRPHHVILDSGSVRLRPMNENDWDLIHRWWNDPDVQYFAAAEDNPSDFRGTYSYDLVLTRESYRPSRP